MLSGYIYNTHSGSVYSYKFINKNAKIFFLYKQSYEFGQYKFELIVIK